MNLLQRITKLQFGKARQLEFLDVFFRLAKDGIAFRDALELMRHTSDSVDKEVVVHLQRTLREGRTVASGMEGWFDPVISSALAAAEQTDDFAEFGAKLVAQQREQSSALGALMSEIGAPLAYIALGLSLSAYFSHSVFPQFDEMVSAERWAPLPRNTYALGQAVLDYWYVALAAVAGGGAFLVFAFVNWTGRLRELLDRVWPFNFYRRMAASGVMESLGLMVSSGHDFRSGLAMVRKNASRYQRMYIVKMIRRLREGRTIPMTLDVNFFPKAEMAHLKMLSEYHGLNQVIVRTGATMRERAVKDITKMGPPIRLLCYAAVAGLYISLILSIYTISSTLQQGAR